VILVQLQIIAFLGSTFCRVTWQVLLIFVYNTYLITAFYNVVATAYSSAAFGRGSGPILIDNVACTGRENRLIDCTFDNHTGDCSHSEDAGVRCYSPPSIGEYETGQKLLALLEQTCF